MCWVRRSILAWLGRIVVLAGQVENVPLVRFAELVFGSGGIETGNAVGNVLETIESKDVFLWVWINLLGSCMCSRTIVSKAF